MSPTPPSTSPSVGGHSPEFRVIRKRNRVPLSCAPCRNRKLKCNRSHPCENCVKRGDAASCSYAQANSRRKNPAQQPAPTTPDDMQNRIDRLEGLVLSLMTNGNQAGGPAAALAAISGESSTGSTGLSNELDLDEDNAGPEESDTEQVTRSFGVMKMDNNKSYYISEAHWGSVLNDIAEVRNFFTEHKKQFEEHAAKVDAARPQSDVPGSALLFGVMKPLSRGEIMTSLPSKYITDLLVARYFNSYDPATHILHGPTFQAQYNRHWEDPSKTEVVWIAMLFAMMRLAMLSFYRERDEPPEFRGKAMDMAASFRNSVSQCLALADYTKSHPHLIEAMVFHLHGDYSQNRDADVSNWVLTGVIARLAMRMGYHRDSKMFPNITPFQGEIRRRIWSFVRQVDILFSSQVGMPSMLRSAESDTDLPRNLYDDDFDENCKELPQPRQLSEPTPISYLITKARLVFIFGRVNEEALSISSTPYEKVMELDADLRHAQKLVPDHLQIRPMEDCQLDPVNLIMARFTVNTVYHKAQIVLHRPYLVRARENPRFTYSRRTCIESALQMLEFQSILDSEARHGRLRGRSHVVSPLNTADFLLAASLVCLDLYHTYQLQLSGRPSGDTYIWGLERRDEMMAMIQRSKEIWDEKRDETMEAFKASNILGVMLGKLHSAIPSTENGARTAMFEPQDEKQNAAMTLGLLSSGMSPMPQGPAPFPDPFKPGEPPMPTGMGASAEISGALSPFSSMFGQMPDMQVNLDWDAWDTYIQNPTFDSSNQFWPMMDPQRQVAPPSLGMAQPPVSSPMGTSRMPSMPNALPDGRIPPGISTMITSPSDSPDSGNSSVPGHCVRRASSRLLSSYFTSSAVVASRTASVSRFQTTPPILGLSLDPYHSGLQVRRNSSRHDESQHNDIEPQSSAESDELDHSDIKPQVSTESPAMPNEEGFSKRRLRHKILDNKTNPPSETVYVGNLFYDLTAEQLRSKMEEFGTVASAWIVYDSRGLNKGAVEEAIRARKEMHRRVLEGRAMIVQFARGPIQTKELEHPPTNSIYIGNLPFGLTDWELQNLFKDIRGYYDVRFPVDRRSGLPRGFAHADFFTVEQAAQAVEILRRKRPHGRTLRVNFTKTTEISNLGNNDVGKTDMETPDVETADWKQ
ncbi:hypothetical protein N7512_002373 [Penicillium capsulatum]|nr:hypothetical protein N7512_002373 [Penicillium capsulatum]